MRYKNFEIDDNKIDMYQENLGLSIEEACELILEENGSIAEKDETTKAIAEATKNAPRRYEKSDKPRKQAKKERKVDATKGRLLTEVKNLIEELGATDTALKTETELRFTFEGSDYTFKLTKHRPPKK